jgi:superoxide dismutase
MMLRTISSVPRAAASSRAMSSFKLPELSFDVMALEPVISGEIMSIHHQVTLTHSLTHSLTNSLTQSSSTTFTLIISLLL